MKGYSLIEFKGNRVLTTSQLAESYETEVQILTNNFNRNKTRYTEGKHYISLRGDDKKQFLRENQIDFNKKDNTTLYLWTEKGSWLHAKSLNTDKAWEAYEMLVDDYYRVKEPQMDMSLLSPEMRVLRMTIDAVTKVQIDAAQTAKEVEVLKEAVTTMQDTFLERDEDWRNMIKGMINACAYRSGKEHKDIRNESYALLDRRAKSNIDRRLNWMKKRLEKAGATKTKITQTNRMDVIEADARLKEIYTTIVKEMSIGTLKIAK